MTPEIREKLIVVMQSDHMPRSSFITSGAIRYFKENQSDAEIQGYHWTIDPTTRVIAVQDFVIEAMLAALPDAMDRVHTLHAKETFKPDSDRHLIYLTLSFCHLLRAAKQIDIKRCFEFASIEITETKLRHCLDILQICELVKPIRQVKLDYYVPLVEQTPLEIAFREGTDPADRNSSRWISRIVEKISGDEDEKFRIEMFKGARSG